MQNVASNLAEFDKRKIFMSCFGATLKTYLLTFTKHNKSDCIGKFAFRAICYPSKKKQRKKEIV